jgi:hypothetical protein
MRQRGYLRLTRFFVQHIIDSQAQLIITKKGRKMEKTHATVNGTGLQISLTELQQYGVEPGARVTIEFGLNRILVTLPILDPQKVEDLALQLTLRYLGDAAQVKAEKDKSPFNQDGWKVGIYRTDANSPVGYLIFSQTGEFLPELSTRFDIMHPQ